MCDGATDRSRELFADDLMKLAGETPGSDTECKHIE